VEVASRAQSSAAGWSSVGGSNTEDHEGYGQDEEQEERSEIMKRFSFVPLQNSLKAMSMSMKEELDVFRNEEYLNEVDV
jgi:succinate dehydrogenase/fumarate reductase flavoprotein subunit